MTLLLLFSYAVVSGSVTCPLAPVEYGKRDEPYGPVQTFGPGSVVIFSLWNHGGCEWDAEHVPPVWTDMSDELGFEPKYDESQMDEWVRVCVEKPIGASRDSLPCAWPSVSAFMASIEQSWEYSAREAGKAYSVGLKQSEGMALEAEEKRRLEAEEKGRQ